MSTRKKATDEVITEVLTRSRRRCCLCYGLSRDAEIKQGQVAHLDQNRDNNRPDNLVFLCLSHHDSYDSQTSQSKGFTISEVKAYRDELYNHIQKLAIQSVIIPASPMFSTSEEQEALNFYTGTHRSQSVVLLVANGIKRIEEINERVPPSDLKWTKSILSEVIQAGWVRRSPEEHSTFELSMNGRRMLDVLNVLPDELKEKAWKAVWSSE
ncbi:MAG: hypothetical protein ACYC1F_01050 [Gallionellaceae bacterium]